MKIAIPTNDRITVAKRTGRCKEFLIAEINDSDIKIKYIENNHTHDEHEHEEEEHEHSHSEITEALEDIDLLLLLNIGKNLRRDIEKRNIKYKKITETNIEKIISEYKL